MKIVCIGDIHGRPQWQKIVMRESDSDLFIFHGDYVTSAEGLSIENQIKEFEKILEFKENFAEKVCLLAGNHDLEHILPSLGLTTSFDLNLHKWFLKNLDKILSNLQIVYTDERQKIIFSHGGVSKTWMNKIGIDKIDDINTQPLKSFAFSNHNDSDNSGDSPEQPPTWIRPEALLGHMVDDYMQIVGHTPMKEILNLKNLWCIDTLLKQYLVIENGNFIIKDT